MTRQLSFHDARRILALLGEAPDGQIKFVDGDLSVVALLGGDHEVPVEEEEAGVITVFSPGVGIFRSSDSEASLGTVEAPGRSIAVETEHDFSNAEILVEDGAFVEYGTPIAKILMEDNSPPPSDSEA